MTDSKGYNDIQGRIAIDTGKIESIGEYHCPEDLYRSLIERVRRYHPSDDISLIERAYEVASSAHEGQLRKSGEPYIIHPLCVSVVWPIWKWTRRPSRRDFSTTLWRTRS